MNRKLVSLCILTILLMFMISMSTDVKVAKASGTISIRADGSIDPPTAPIQRVGAVYTLTDNINDGIVIGRSHIVVDGAGFMLQGSGGGNGIKLYGVNDVTVQNMTVENFSYGIWLESSSRVVFSDNIINDTEYGIGVFGTELTHYMHAISDSNLVDGKPVYYITNQTDLLISAATHPKIGFLALIGCADITVEGLTLSNLGQGLLLAYANNARIKNNNVTHNNYGLWVRQSSNISISRNNIIENSQGVYVTWSSCCNISENKIATNDGYGVNFTHSSNNTVSSNDITGNEDGVFASSSSVTTISANNITENNRYDVWLYESLAGVISENTIGIVRIEDHSDSNVISGNRINDKVNLISSHYNTVFENNIENSLSLSYSNHNSIFANKILMSGLTLGSSGSNNISRNQITNRQGLAVSITGYSNIISCNNLTRSGGGIGLGNVESNIISGNNITNNGGPGIRFYTSRFNTVTENNIRDNGWGTWGTEGWGNEISRNNITNNLYSGIYFEGWSSGNFISDNYIASNIDAIYFYNSEENIVTYNTIVNNKVGIRIYGSNREIISGNTIMNSSDNGVIFSWSNRDTVCENTITSSFNNGIKFSASKNSVISGNNIAESYTGVWFESSSGNTLFANTIVSNWDGVGLYLSSDNTFYDNNFINNTRQAYIQTPGYRNFWNNSYPYGGNYWSNYDGTDGNRDGLGDSIYEVDENNTDHYPLMGLFSSFNISLGYYANVVSNSSIDYFEYFAFNHTIRMYVSNMTENQTHGFVRISIPHALMYEPFNVTIDGSTPTYWNYTLYDNGTHRWIYFEYEHSTLEIVITPELPPLIILPLFITLTLLAVIIHRKTSARLNKAHILSNRNSRV